MTEINDDMMMLLLGLLEQPIRVTSMTTAASVSISHTRTWKSRPQYMMTKIRGTATGIRPKVLDPAIPRVKEPEE